MAARRSKLQRLQAQQATQNGTALEAESAANVLEEERDSLRAVMVQIHKLVSQPPNAGGSFA